MAQELYEHFLDAAETQYQSGKYPLMSMSASNIQTGKIKFTKIGQFDDGTIGPTEYAIQRWKRVKEVDIDDSNTANPGDNYITVLNQAQEIQYDTIKTQRTSRKMLTIVTKKGEETNALPDSSPYVKTIATKTENKLISKEERAVAVLIAAGTEVTLDAATLADPNLFATAFTDVVDEIEEFVDEFKYSATAAVLANKRISRTFAKLEGQGYYQGSNTFGKDFRGAFNYGGIDFYQEDVLKSIRIGNSNTNADKIVLGIIMADDAYADAGLEQGVIPINETLFDRSVQGHAYDDLNKVIDPKRVKYITATITDLISAGMLPKNYVIQKKVNA